MVSIKVGLFVKRNRKEMPTANYFIHYATVWIVRREFKFQDLSVPCFRCDHCILIISKNSTNFPFFLFSGTLKVWS